MARAAKVDPSVAGAPWWAYRRPPVRQTSRPRASRPARQSRTTPRPPTADHPDTVGATTATSPANRRLRPLRAAGVHRRGVARGGGDHRHQTARQRRDRSLARAGSRDRGGGVLRTALHASTSGRTMAAAPAAARRRREARGFVLPLHHVQRRLRRRRRRRHLRPRRPPVGRAVDRRPEGTRPPEPAVDQLHQVVHRRHVLPVRPKPRGRVLRLRLGGIHRVLLLVPGAGGRGAVRQPPPLLHLHDVRPEHRVLAVVARQGSTDAARARRRCVGDVARVPEPIPQRPPADGRGRLVAVHRPSAPTGSGHARGRCSLLLRPDRRAQGRIDPVAADRHGRGRGARRLHRDCRCEVPRHPEPVGRIGAGSARPGNGTNVEGWVFVLARLQLAQPAVGSERRRNGALPPVSVGVPQRTSAPRIARVGGRDRH